MRAAAFSADSFQLGESSRAVFDAARPAPAARAYTGAARGLALVPLAVEQTPHPLLWSPVPKVIYSQPIEHGAIWYGKTLKSVSDPCQSTNPRVH